MLPPKKQYASLRPLLVLCPLSDKVTSTAGCVGCHHFRGFVEGGLSVKCVYTQFVRKHIDETARRKINEIMLSCWKLMKRFENYSKEHEKVVGYYEERKMAVPRDSQEGFETTSQLLMEAIDAARGKLAEMGLPADAHLSIYRQFELRLQKEIGVLVDYWTGHKIPLSKRELEILNINLEAPSREDVEKMREIYEILSYNLRIY